MQTCESKKLNGVAILAIGTEVTDGQIVDRNSAWLSSRLTDLGYCITQHRSIPDDRAMIERSLRELAVENSWIFVTGGLGPTSDDFTRECVAQFAQRELQWHEPSWKRILERLKLRNVPVTENQKQQCYYPVGAEILENANGTAHGFYLKGLAGEVKIVVLPGPPNEIEAVWRDGLANTMKAIAPQQTRELTILRTMGMGEGALADRIEKIIDEVLLAKPASVRPVVGYRAHVPYVEVKLWSEPATKPVVEKVIKSIEESFAELIVNRNDEDVADAFLQFILQQSKVSNSVVCFDSVTDGALLERVIVRLKGLNSEPLTKGFASGFVYIKGSAEKLETMRENWRSGISADKNDWQIFSLYADSANETLHLRRETVGASDSSYILNKDLALPKMMVSLAAERGRRWSVEMLLRNWMMR